MLRCEDGVATLEDKKHEGWSDNLCLFGMFLSLDIPLYLAVAFAVSVAVAVAERFCGISL